jgi:hypothetical protein
MLAWLIAIGVGAAVAIVQYGPPALGREAAVAALRAVSVTLLVALVLDAPIGWSRAARPLAVLDVSSSWRRQGDSALFTAARRRLDAIGGDSSVLFGDSARDAAPAAVPGDRRSDVRAAVDRVLAAGRPAAIITDGELDDPAALAALPAGSRVELFPHPPAVDLAVLALDLPRDVVSGDTIAIRVTVAAGGLPTPAGTLALRLDDRSLGSRPVAPLAARAERTETIRVVVTGADGPAVLRAIAAVPGDREPRNDTLATTLEVSRAAGAVFVSTAPDYDARFALEILRGAVALPTRGFFRIAPGLWRVDGTLAAVADGEVRRAAADAPLVVLHGDTAIFGAPRVATHGSLALLPTVEVTPIGVGEWYASAPPASPLSAAIAGTPWDSLPPIDVSPVAPAPGGWVGLRAARARRYESRAVVEGSLAGRRVVVVQASGLWRWRFRGGVAADAYASLWGGIFDWLAAERPDARAAIPADGAVRSGEPVRWRRGTAADSAVRVVLVPRDGSAADSMELRFGSGVTVETAPRASGVYDVRTAGGASVLVVNPSREWLPNRPRVAAGSIGGAESSVGGGVPRLRALWWVYLLVVGVLSAEWLGRRRLGLR